MIRSVVDSWIKLLSADATEGVKMISSYITKAKGGEGVLREVAEFVLKINTSNSQNEMLRGKSN